MLRLTYASATELFLASTLAAACAIPMLQTWQRPERQGPSVYDTLIVPRAIPVLPASPAPPKPLPVKHSLPTFKTSERTYTIAFGPTPSGLPTLAGAAPHLTLEQRLLDVAPGIDRTALHLAVKAMVCASRKYGDRDRLVVIDYSKPSTARRLWAFDLRSGALLWNEYVLHGSGSGPGLYARSFSNNVDSNQSSLGLFELQSPFKGALGPAMSMIGLEKGVNSNALERGIWLHGTDYVNDERAARGAVSTSEGCAAVQRGVIVPMINSLKGGAWLFSYYPDRKWLATSGFLNGKYC